MVTIWKNGRYQKVPDYKYLHVSKGHGHLMVRRKRRFRRNRRTGEKVYYGKYTNLGGKGYYHPPRPDSRE